MTHRLLDSTRTSTAFEAMCGVAVTQFVRENRDAELAPCVLDGTLHVGLVHTVSHDGPGARVAAGIVAWEKPGPSPAKLVFGIFPGQAMRQHQRDLVLFVSEPD